jgi:pimeloyl-ACP methyl ester carboxylesterase
MLDKHNLRNDIHLVGHSGGGAVAMLVASKNDRLFSVNSVRTLAGNLDHSEVMRNHRVTPLRKSENPANFAMQAAHIPQIHYYGGNDTVIIPRISREFVHLMPPSPCIERRHVADADHSTGWRALWSQRYSEKIACSQLELKEFLQQ